MGALPGWMPKLIELLNWGCSTSPWFVDLADENKVLERGSQIILDLWPYVRELPLNISAVRAEVPAHMEAATKLLNRLGDSELEYQRLFLQQFDLAGIPAEKYNAENTNPHTRALQTAMSRYCTQSGFANGIYAIVTAELAATMYCRASLPLYERYFEKHASKYDAQLITAGLEWLRLHAKTHTRHAIWMKRMLDDLGVREDDKLPEAAQHILNALFALWECPAEVPQLAAGPIS